MKYSTMKESIIIFEKYGLGDEWLEADHDIIYGPSIDVKFNKEDEEKVIDLGWWKNDDSDCWSCHC